MGTPFITWQDYVADVSLEVDADGLFHYQTIVVTLPRQSGKTTLDLACGVQNALLPTTDRPRRVWYTAQSGGHASAKWREMAEAFSSEKSYTRDLATARLSNGSEALEFVTGAKLQPHPPGPESLHSKQSDRNTVDEAWAFSLLEGRALQQAFIPTQQTRQHKTGQVAQTWYISTEGTVESAFLNGILDRARAGDPTIALFDWGIGPDDDPMDLDLVYAKHPAAGSLVTPRFLAAAAADMADSPSEFARAFGNRRTGSTERVIQKEAWEAGRFDGGQPDAAVCLGAAVGVDGVDTTITATYQLRGATVTVVVAHLPGSAWALDTIIELCGRMNCPIAIDRIGPSAALFDAVERAGLTMIPLTPAAVTAAAANVYSGITNTVAGEYKPTWLYVRHSALDDAAELATRRWIGDGAWTWGRRASSGSISALEAGTLSTWGVSHLPKARGLQLF